MLSCKEATQLISESQERKLTLIKMISLKFHLMMCYLCRRFDKQTKVLGRILKLNLSSKVPSSEEKPEQLSLEAKERLKTALRDNKK